MAGNKTAIWFTKQKHKAGFKLTGAGCFAANKPACAGQTVAMWEGAQTP